MSKPPVILILPAILTVPLDFGGLIAEPAIEQLPLTVVTLVFESWLGMGQGVLGLPLVRKLCVSVLAYGSAQGGAPTCAGYFRLNAGCPVVAIPPAVMIVSAFNTALLLPCM